MPEFEMEPAAYCKMVLHALKYPWASICGLLVGERVSGVWVVRESVALVHQSVALAPPLEAALIQTDAWAATLGWTTLGIYHANDGLNDLTRPLPIRRLAERVALHFPDALLLTLDNSALGATASEPPFSLYSLHPEVKGWEPMPRSKMVLQEEEATLQLCSTCVQSKLYRELVDFDNHLENPHLDFTNTALSTKITAIM